MYRIVKSNPKTKKELRRERAAADAQPGSTMFSIYFTRGMLILCLALLGFLIGWNINEKMTTYEQSRWLLRQEERLAAINMLEDDVRRKVAKEMEEQLLAEKQKIAAASPSVGAPSPATAQAAHQPQPAANPNPALATTANPAPIQPAQPRQPIRSTSSELDRQLAAIREEQAMLGEQLEHMKNPNANPAVPAPQPQPGPRPSVTERPPQHLPGTETIEMEDDLAAAAMAIQAEGIARAEATAKLSPTEQRILDAPALARVVKYDDDWQFVVLDGGSTRNIAPGTKFAVRRGSELICEIQVEDVEPDYSTANLIGRARRMADAPKPKVGDDVIGYPLF